MPVQSKSTAHRPAGSAASRASRRARLVDTRRALNPILDVERTSDDLLIVSLSHYVAGHDLWAFADALGHLLAHSRSAGLIASPDLAHKPNLDAGPAQINRLDDG